MKRLLFCFALVVATIAVAPFALAAPPPSPDAEAEDKLPPKHDPVTMKVGVVATELNKFDLANGSYNVEFIATVRCDHEPCNPDLDVANGEIAGKPEKLHDEPLFKVFKVKAELAAVVDLSEYRSTTTPGSKRTSSSPAGTLPSSRRPR